MSTTSDFPASSALGVDLTHLVVDVEIYKEGEEDGEERDFPPWMFQEKDGKEGYLKGSDPVVSLALHERLYIRLCR